MSSVTDGLLLLLLRSASASWKAGSAVCASYSTSGGKVFALWHALATRACRFMVLGRVVLLTPHALLLSSVGIGPFAIFPRLRV